ncbi:MAG: archease [Chloroflexi bacterium]|nr:archease [Chloroflexota bacterium]MBU4226432.1 archease [Chloroflexota bacterium]
MGFEEIAHTADWALRVWADDLEGLFAEAARGMNALSGAQLAEGPQVKRSFAAQSADAESLLVAFLSELVYYAEQEHLMFEGFQVSMFEGSQGWTLKAEMSGAPLKLSNKAIKAVTYHNLKIRQTARGYEVEIVFDV